ncbi:hypothetical protein E2C01_045542 [Portunus trituberculatus]|uniref:Uncharacterized protein n=1 Tax=Portunus trituberculatus TaxID=210409 RepID=A0A5B7G2C3_PORTR|nr:hypothetical protein [Portunus trituberculatus]
MSLEERGSSCARLWAARWCPQPLTPHTTNHTASGQPTAPAALQRDATTRILGRPQQVTLAARPLDLSPSCPRRHVALSFSERPAKEWSPRGQAPHFVRLQADWRVAGGRRIYRPARPRPPPPNTRRYRLGQISRHYVLTTSTTAFYRCLNPHSK